MSRPYLLILLLSVTLSSLAAGDRKQSFEFVIHCHERLTDHRTIEGDAPGWFFPMREIKQLSLGDFWEGSWKDLARNQSDPVPSMLEFHEALKGKGVELLVVPIPSKATVYPEKFSKKFKPGQASGITPFLNLLQNKGLNVINLEEHFIEKRKTSSDKFWCEQDAHFSPKACQEVAKLIRLQLKEKFKIEPKENYSIVRSRPREIEIVGDLVAYTDWEKRIEKEKLPVQFIGTPEALDSDIDSSILLLGDSHTLVFSDAENFHCDGAGLFDHLSYEMGGAVDHEGSASGGLVTSRVNLYRKVLANPGYWKKKRVVVWVFTGREFTQSTFSKGFVSVPIDRG